MYNVEIYEDKYGKSEVKEYIKSLRQKGNKDSNIKFNKIVSYIRILQEKGLLLENHILNILIMIYRNYVH